MHADATITEVRWENPRAATLFFDRAFEAEPGQFTMVWLPGKGERPFSLAYPDAITVKVFGPFSETLVNLKAGQRLGLRGPLGRGFPLHDGMLLIGGGVGIAPIRMLAARIADPVIILGGKTADELFYLSEFKEMGKVLVATEDGSLGHRGLVTDLLPEQGEYAAVCGPELMMAACLKLFPQGPSKVFACLERYMKCAIGLCGTCTCSGYRVCTDGPVFSAVQLATMPDFGRRRRTKSGRFDYFTPGDER